MDLLYEDLGYFDLTTIGLGIGDRFGKMRFFSKHEIVLSGCDEVLDIFKKCNLEAVFYKKSGEFIEANELILECIGKAKALHASWKITQNILEYASGIATYTFKMTRIAKEINPKIVIATTRKNFPGSKALMLKAVLDGGGVAHRLGLFDSILIFPQHRLFFESKNEFEDAFKTLKERFIEKKIAIEISNLDEARYFAKLGADILQCEKMAFDEIKSCVELKKEYPYLLIAATGGITLENVADYAKSGIDFIVTSAPYHAKAAEIKVLMNML